MESEKEFLRQYKADKYPRPSVTTDTVTFSVNREKELSVLLVKRGRHPFLGCYALPGGFLNPKETVEQCAVREITEETNVTPKEIFPIGVFSAPDRDPRGWVISCAFLSAVAWEEVHAVGMDDAAEALWFTVKFDAREKERRILLRREKREITARLEVRGTLAGRTEFQIVEANDLAFDHAAILATALEQLKAKVADETLTRCFLPEQGEKSALPLVRAAVEKAIQ